MHYRSAAALARCAVIAMASWTLVALALFAAELGRLHILGEISNGAAVSLRETSVSDALVNAGAWAEVVVFVLSAGLFLAWLWRTVANERVLGPSGYTTLLAIGPLLLFVAGGAVRYAAAFTEQPINSVSTLTGATVLEAGSIMFAILAAVLAVVMIVIVTRRHAARAALRTAPPPLPEPPPVALTGVATAHLHVPAWPGPS